MDNQQLKTQIDIIHNLIIQLQIQLGQLERACSHKFRQLTATEVKDRWMSVGAVCIICRKYFGWRCVNSPDSVCHYFTEGNKIEIIGGLKINPPKGHDKKRESEDCCIYCKSPEERK